MSSPNRIIKKYPNRRLYDTAISSYITLDDIKELVLARVNFKVIDIKTNEDVTNHVLLQIISENEGGRKPIFTTEILQNLIRFYGNPMQKSMSEFLEQGLAFFMQQQTDFQQNIQKYMHKTFSPLSLWESAFDQFLNKKKKK